MIDTKHENSVKTFSPEFLLAPILHALTTGKHDEMLLDYRPRLRMALGQIVRETNFWELLRWGLEFLYLNKKHPATVEAIAEWFKVNGSLGGNGGSRDYVETSLQQEIELWADPLYAEYKECADLEVMIQALLELARQEYHAHHHTVAANMASGASPAESHSSDPDVKNLVGMSLPDQARIYINRKMA